MHIIQYDLTNRIYGAIQSVEKEVECSHSIFESKFRENEPLTLFYTFKIVYNLYFVKLSIGNYFLES
jgi:hypothetical protein